MIGSVIDKYEVLQKLGEGATATVYRGRHLSIGRDVAIKVLHPHLSASTRYRERFNREARAVGRLSHENIVSILDYSGQSADDCYIVTELVDGATLQALLEEHGRIPSELACLIGIELCHALGFAHAASVIHRDIKPENVMIRRDGRVKLMDFGVARVLDEGQITLDGSLLGSPAYMSPQQALDEKLDGRSDLFSFGTVLFYSVTGTVPFSGTNASVILRNIIDGQRLEVLAINPSVAPALASVIDRLLQPRPDDRYPSAQATAEALEAVLVESGIAHDHPTINLRSWLVAPRETEAALDTHLRAHLLARGKERLTANDAVGALQLFNRLLAIDEDHAEVLALIQSLHAPAPSRRKAGIWASVAAASLLLVGTLAWWFYPREPLEAERPSAATAAVVVVPPPQAPPAEPAVELTALPQGPVEPVSSRLAPLPPHIKKLTAAPDKGTPSTAALVVPEAVAILPGTVTLEVLKPAEVWLDGKRVGSFRTGPSSEWIGTRSRPIEVQAGTHTLELKNSGAVPYVEEFTIGAGESRHVRAELKEKPTVFIIHAGMPRDCTLTVGTAPYGTVANIRGQIQLTGPDPATPVRFDCPGKGVYEMPLGPSLAGKERFLPDTLPAGLL